MKLNPLTSRSPRSIRLVFIVLLAISKAALASNCVQKDDSKSAEEDYLACEYKQADKRLRSEVSSLIARVQRSSVWSTQPEMAKAFRTHTISGIKDADLHWRALTKAECEVLVGEQFMGGTGEYLGVTVCMTAKTEERIKYLKESDIYKWYQ
jgi:uncharacterized protein YecT (DUF1311 family)